MYGHTGILETLFVIIMLTLYILIQAREHNTQENTHYYGRISDPFLLYQNNLMSLNFTKCKCPFLCNSVFAGIQCFTRSKMQKCIFEGSICTQICSVQNLDDKLLVFKICQRSDLFPYLEVGDDLMGAAVWWIVEVYHLQAVVARYRGQPLCGRQVVSRHA